MARVASPLTLTLYRAVGHALTPLTPLFLRARLKRGKENADRLHERIGQPRMPRPDGSLVWLHAASVGETLSILPLIGRIVAGGHRALLTTGTVTSAELAAARLPEGAAHQFVPLDLPGFTQKFLTHWRPDLAIFCESEIWPNLITGAQQRQIPIGFVNGRMSERSARKWARLPGTARMLLGPLAFCLAQSPADAARYAALGAPAQAIGNLKFDARPLPVDGDALLTFERTIEGRPVLVAASTHPGEEILVLEAATQLREHEPDLLTIIVPRHPMRGAEIAEVCATGGIVAPLRSRGGMADAGTTIYIADTLGELGLFYTLAHVAFVGGSLVPVGGHNPIEPAKLGAPILHGPETANFRDIFSAFDAAEAARPVRDATDLARVAAELLADPAARARLVANAREIVEANEGAIEKTYGIISAVLDQCGSRHP